MQAHAKQEHLGLEDVYAKRQKARTASPKEMAAPVVFLSSTTASFILVRRLPSMVEKADFLFRTLNNALI